MAEAQNAARDLGNAPANELTPTRLAARARELAAELGLQCEVLGREQIRYAGMGAFAAVAQGTAEEPQLITLRYAPEDATGPMLGFVGKAVTFDSGGISIKPGPKMADMKYDMCGGAAVLEAIGAIARLGLPVNVIAVIGATENLPSGTRVQARRHRPRALGHDDRDHQHGRRGPARAVPTASPTPASRAPNGWSTSRR